MVCSEPLPISPDTVKESVTEPAAQPSEENTTVDDETFYDARRGATVDFLAASPTAAPEVKDAETVSSGRQVAVGVVTEGEFFCAFDESALTYRCLIGVTPATPEPPVQLPSVAETENIISDPVQPPTPVEEEHAAVAGTTSEVAQDSKRTSILVAEPLPVPNVPGVSTTCDECEAAQVTDGKACPDGFLSVTLTREGIGGSEAKASAAPERDGQLPSPTPAATEQAAERTLSSASTAEQKTEPVETSASSVNTQDTHPMGTVMSTASAPAPVTTPAQDAEGKQTRVEHDSSEHTTEGKGSDGECYACRVVMSSKMLIRGLCRRHWHTRRGLGCNNTGSRRARRLCFRADTRCRCPTPGNGGSHAGGGPGRPARGPSACDQDSRRLRRVRVFARARLVN